MVEIAVETAVWHHRRIDQQGLQSMALGKVRRIVAAKRAADQQRSPKLGQTGLELPNGLTRVVMQGGNPQTLGLAESLQRRRQMARLLRAGSC